MISPDYPRISTELRETHSHHVGLFVNLKHITKRSLLVGEVLDKRPRIRKLVHNSKNVFQITP
jgi:hypothetical protein